MSGTKGSRPREVQDGYPTPHLYVRQIVKQLISEGFITAETKVLDPAAGDGRVIRWIRREVGKEVETHACEIRKIHMARLEEVCNAVYLGDFLKYTTLPQYDLIITNPPYSCAEEYIRKSVTLLRKRGQLVLLLRLGFLAGQQRNEDLWRRYSYSGLYICTSRPSFVAGGNDSTEYGWVRFPRPGQEKKELTLDRPRNVDVVHLPSLPRKHNYRGLEWPSWAIDAD